MPRFFVILSKAKYLINQRAGILHHAQTCCLGPRPKNDISYGEGICGSIYTLLFKRHTILLICHINRQKVSPNMNGSKFVLKQAGIMIP